MEQVSNPFQACNDIFFKPRRVFATIKDKHNWSWLPFLILVSLTALPTYLYFNFVDFSWYVETVMVASMGDVSPAEQDAMRNTVSQSMALYGGMAMVFIGIPIMSAVFAIYLNLTSKIDEENVLGFTDWYGFVWWISMPGIIGSLISVGLIVMADSHELPPLVMAPTTLAYLLNIDMQNDWFSLLQVIRLESVWTIYLTIVGLVQWTALSSKTAVKIALAPYLAIWGIWAFFIII